MEGLRGPTNQCIFYGCFAGAVPTSQWDLEKAQQFFVGSPSDVGWRPFSHHLLHRPVVVVDTGREQISSGLPALRTSRRQEQ